MDKYLWDREVMRVYCDCSASDRLKAFGVAASFIFNGSVIVRSRTAYDSTMQLLPTAGELQAVLYGIEQVKAVLKDAFDKPSKILMYSDVDHIEHLLYGSVEKSFGDFARRIAAARESFDDRWPSVALEISYLPPDEQRFNPYYASAHNAARRQVSVGRK